MQLTTTLALIALALPFGSLASAIPARSSGTASKGPELLPRTVTIPSREEITAYFNPTVFPTEDEGTTPDQKRQIFPRVDDVNTCSDSTFEKLGSHASSVRDCGLLRDRMRNNSSAKGAYRLPAYSEELFSIRHGGCLFAASINSASDVYIGNLDIADLINDSIDKFAKDGKVGAKGLMGCMNENQVPEGSRVSWVLMYGGK